MKIRNLGFMLLLVSFLLSACGKDECLVLAEVIPGEWTLPGGEVEFKSDGTLVDPGDNLVGFSTGGQDADIKTWALSGNDLTLRAEIDPSAGSGFLEVEVEVTEFECDKMTFDLQIISAELKRK